MFVLTYHIALWSEDRLELARYRLLKSFFNLLCRLDHLGYPRQPSHGQVPSRQVSIYQRRFIYMLFATIVDADIPWQDFLMGRFPHGSRCFTKLW